MGRVDTMVLLRKSLSTVIVLFVLISFLTLSIRIGIVASEREENSQLVDGEEQLGPPLIGKNVPDNPWVEIPISVSEAQNVTVIERTGTHISVTWDIPTLMGPGGWFGTIAEELYNVTSDGDILTIHCQRPWMDGGGNNIVATSLDDTPGRPNRIWATRIVDYTLGPGGMRETRFNALGFHWDNHTRLGDYDSEIVLSFSYIYEVLPPENLTTRVQGNDLLLEWSPSRSTGIDYYIIYGGHSPRSLDLLNPVGYTPVGSSSTSWIHTNGAIRDEYYYVVRAYNATYGLKSYTSNTAGIFALRFEEGGNAFSLPLRPFIEMNVSELMGAIPGSTTVYWMDSSDHWVAYDGPGYPDSVAEIGKAYVVDVPFAVRFVFAGMPGSMIRYKDGLGFDEGTREGLSAVTSSDSVLLSWNDPPAEVDYYRVLRSNSRDGFFKQGEFHQLGKVNGGLGTVFFTDIDPFSDSNEKYYLVVPVDNGGLNGSASYSIAVVRMEFEPGTKAFGSPIKLLEEHTVDSMSKSRDPIVGVAYFIKGVWKFHAKPMPAVVYDATIAQGEGYQMSVDLTGPVRIEFVGI
jgi:hypothetical protein